MNTEHPIAATLAQIHRLSLDGTLAEMPELPQARMIHGAVNGPCVDYYTADQMRAYAQAALAALPGGGVEQPKTGTVADYPDADLLRRAVRGAHRGREVCIRWSHIADVFALGSTYSAQLCRRFGLDPNDQVGTPTPNPHEADQ